MWTTYLKNKILDHVFGATVYTAPATVYLALSTTTPADDGSGFTEPSGNNYSRKAVTNNTTNWANASGGQKENAVAIAMAQASGDWGTVTHWGLFDAASGGNLLAWAALASGARAIVAGDDPEAAVGALTITTS